MKTIVVLEPDDSYFKDLEQAIRKIDEASKVERFLDMKEFFGWIKTNVEAAKEEGAKKVDIKLFILELESLPAKVDPEMLARTQTMLVQSGLTDEEVPAGYVLTTHESEFDKFRDYVHPVIMNILSKPFDDMTLFEFLKIAIKGRAPIATDMYQHDGEAQLEIVKEVNMTALSEIGFRTQSLRPIETGTIAKYYCDRFAIGEGRGNVFAYCRQNVENEPGVFTCSFSFFGTDPDILRQLRMNIQKEKEKETKALPDAEGDLIYQEKNVLVLTKDLEEYMAVKDKIEERFEHIKVLHAKDLNDLAKSGLPEGLELHAAFVLDDFHVSSEYERIKTFVDDNFKVQAEFRMFAMHVHPVEDYEKLDRYQPYDDYYLLPLDRFFFFRKIKQIYPDWKVKENEVLTRDVVQAEEIIHTATPVTVSKISETSLTLMHTRAIDPGKIRTFVMESVDGTAYEEITAMCHYSEEVEKGSFKNDFVFVGVTDEKQKFIRKWLIQVYAKAKADAANKG